MRKELEVDPYRPSFLNRLIDRVERSLDVHLDRQNYLKTKKEVPAIMAGALILTVLLKPDVSRSVSYQTTPTPVIEDSAPTVEKWQQTPPIKLELGKPVYLDAYFSAPIPTPQGSQ